MSLERFHEAQASRSVGYDTALAESRRGRWAVIDPLSWDHMFEKLVTFKDTYGHCRVPQHWKEDPRFGKWVNTQRTTFKRGKLPTDRRDKLESIGFVWNTKR